MNKKLTLRLMIVLMCTLGISAMGYGNVYETRAFIPKGGDANILYDASAIHDAVNSPSKGKGKIIPYFGYYLKTDIKMKTNSNGLWYLSNFFESDPQSQMFVEVKLKYKGKEYSFNNTESAYQAGKSIIYGTVTTDSQIKEFVKASPGYSKYLANTKYGQGRNHGNNAWGKIVDMMRGIVRQKFINGPLGQELVNDTGETTLIEGNEWGDTTWGRPFDGKTHSAGQSLLGNILMEVRKDIASGSAVFGTEPAYEIK